MNEQWLESKLQRVYSNLANFETIYANQIPKEALDAFRKCYIKDFLIYADYVEQRNNVDSSRGEPIGEDVE